MAPNPNERLLRFLSATAQQQEALLGQYRIFVGPFVGF
jgi:hypothetical protein